jgi:hypothetical protein
MTHETIEATPVFLPETSSALQNRLHGSATAVADSHATLATKDA